MHPLQGRSRLGVLFEFEPVEAEPLVRLAELLPGRLLVLVEVFEVVEVVAQVVQVVLLGVELLDELVAVVAASSFLVSVSPS